MQGPVSLYRLLIEKLKSINWLGPLAFRLYLAPIFIGVGAHKFANFEDMVAWFGNSDWGLGLPMPTLMVFLAASAELFGGLALLLGVATEALCHTAHFYHAGGHGHDTLGQRLVCHRSR